MSDMIILGRTPQHTPAGYETRGLLAVGGSVDDTRWQPCPASAPRATPAPLHPAASGGQWRAARPASGPTLPTAQHVAEALRGMPQDAVEKIRQQVGWKQR